MAMKNLSDIYNSRNFNGLLDHINIEHIAIKSTTVEILMVYRTVYYGLLDLVIYNSRNFNGLLDLNPLMAGRFASTTVEILMVY